MKKIVKELYLFIFDLINLIRPMWRLITIQKFKKEIYESKYQKDLYIIGNGPSAKEFLQHPPENRDKINICTVNFSITTDNFFDIKPEIHCFADPDFFNKTDDERIQKVIDIIEKKINWDLTIIIPFSKNKTFYKHCLNNKHIRILRFAGESWQAQSNFAKKIRLYFYNKGWFTPKLQNVIVACIFNAILLGYKKLFLLGVEHSWLNEIFVNQQNQVCLLDKHFYGNNSILWKKNDTETYKVHEILKTLSYTFEAYWELKYFSEKRNVHIINKTKDSFIDAFERG